MKTDTVKFDNLPKTNDEYISVTNGCIRFIDNYFTFVYFNYNYLDSLVKTLVDNRQKTLEKSKKEIVDNDETLNIFDGIGEEARTIKDLKKDCPDKIRNLEEALLKYMGENDLKNLKTEFPDKWKFLIKKISYPYEYLNSIENYQKHVGNLK